MKVKKYIFLVSNEQESSDVQKALFKAGFTWPNGKQEVLNTYAQVLFACSATRWITFKDRHVGTGEMILSREVTWIDNKTIIEDPFCIEGAVYPKKNLKDIIFMIKHKTKLWLNYGKR